MTIARYSAQPSAQHASRRTLVATAVALAALAVPLAAHSQTAPKLKVGLMLPYTGTFAALGTAIENGFRLQVDTARDKPWLFGHSDGGSIALLYAARYPNDIAGAIVLAPHTVVEDVALASIELARQAYVDGELRQRLARHHDDPDSAFWGWNRIWLQPSFRHWSIDDEIAAIRCPLLAVQGLDDEYGTLAQIHGIARRVPQTQLLELADCGHSAHRDQPQALIAAVQAFVHATIAAASVALPAAAARQAAGL